ncbi:MAG TPA: hypothetical protein VIM75_17780 [Ohtaekwangia sp.]|uniref:hypothetical protein n=1 Tax=Ohtaekwangia sp. TaxID=2066019 RepID=UPI002F9483F6
MEMHNNTTTENKSRVRSLLAVIGILTAIIGSLVLFPNVNTTEQANANVSNPLKTLKIISTSLPSMTFGDVVIN